VPNAPEPQPQSAQDGTATCSHCGRRPGRVQEGDRRLAGLLICDECAASSQAMRTVPLLFGVVGGVVVLTFLGWWLLR
jgi:hypothetical protein